MRIRLLLVLLFVGVAFDPAVPHAGGRERPFDPREAAPPSDSPLATQPVRTREYSMSGHIRPLLFWMGKSDIGLARIVWREGAAGAFGYDFLVGTDPARAPRSLNRWGYISETVAGPEATMLALMTGTDEGSYEDAEASVNRERSAGDFRAIETQMRGAVATWQVARVRTSTPLTVHDLHQALTSVRDATSAVRRREMTLPPGGSSGFLTAAARLVGAASHGDTAATREKVRYVFGQATYEMWLRRVTRNSSTFGDRQVPSVQTEFEVRNLATDDRTRFDLVAGTTGDLAGVPIAIAWQPRWWLKVRLDLQP